MYCSPGCILALDAGVRHTKKSFPKGAANHQDEPSGWLLRTPLFLGQKVSTLLRHFSLNHRASYWANGPLTQRVQVQGAWGHCSAVRRGSCGNVCPARTGLLEGPTFPSEDRDLPYLAGSQVRIAILRQNRAKSSKSQGSKLNFSPFSGRMRAGRPHLTFLRMESACPPGCILGIETGARREETCQHFIHYGAFVCAIGMYMAKPL